ncbi:AraC family transcriptional regulator [Lichenihabitans psoromatis]|uniref:AraC family transcriptional regulator n=1 Tax=Lichenihabitans psoromatis TaxID=2528642 RepID=UPI001038398A|nr:AraC family transcriptional regulator [Lichenihabitans psoromatis]
MDPLSDILALLKPRSFMSRALDAGGRWSFQVPRGEGLKCYALLSGQCWFELEGAAEPLWLTAGDCLLLPRPLWFRFASDLTMQPVDVMAVFPQVQAGGVASINGGGECFGVGGYFEFAGNHADLLLGALPPIVHIKKEDDKAALRWCLDRIRQELREPQPGGALIAEHLVHMLLLQALRLHIAEGSSGGVGWLFALADHQISAAISAMHREPARRWTLQALAAVAGMSRSSFALRFKTMVGVSSMDYLTRWRMLLAGDRLSTSRDSISVIAPALGYESESAFSTAFKRVMGCPPRHYGRRGRDARVSGYAAS